MLTPTLLVSKIPSLDGLRAISVVLVLLGHLEGTHGFPLLGLRTWFGDYANLGVRVFFVISGFLITLLLIDEHKKWGGISLPLFYARRGLRIVPAFFAFLGTMSVCAALQLIPLKGADLVHALTYTGNFQAERSWYTGHLWSLSVEEQFYLLWPFALGLAGAMRSMHIAAAVVLIGPIARAGTRLFLMDDPLGQTEMFPIVADSLAAGCLLAGWRERLWQFRGYRAAVESNWVLYAIPLLLLAINRGRGYTVVWVFGETVMNLAIALLIDRCVSWPSRGGVHLLNLRPVAWIGLMSYSLYLWQQPFLNRRSNAWISAFPANVLLTFACALLSYYLLEKPLMRMRKRFSRTEKSGVLPPVHA